MWMCNDRISTWATEGAGLEGVCMYWRAKAVGLWECSASLGAFHCITLTSNLDADTLTHAACRSFNLQKLENFSYTPFRLSCCLPFDQSFYLITSVTKVTPLPSTIPGNTIVIYVVACTCLWSSPQVTLLSDHPILIFIHLPIYGTRLT